MANRCAGLDPTWAHLPTPAPTHAAAASHYFSSSSPASWLTSAAACFENEALTSALRASMAPTAHAYSASAAASSFSCPTTPSSSTTSSASELLSACSGGGHDDAPVAPPTAASTPARASGPRAGRVTKRKPRQQSRRPQTTTYITTDPANFSRMVQEITGLAIDDGAAKSDSEAVRNWTTTPPAAPACVLPTLDTSAFLFDRAAAAASVPAAPEEKSGAVSAAAGDGGSSELEALAAEWGFPTLESWWMI